MHTMIPSPASKYDVLMGLGMEARSDPAQMAAITNIELPLGITGRRG